MDARAQKSDNTVLYVLLAVFGALGLTCLLGFGCMAMGVVSFARLAASLPTGSGSVIDEEIAAELAAERFLDDVSDGDVDAAYDKTSKGFQSRQTREQFRAFVAQQPRLANANERNTDTQTNAAGRLTLKATIKDSMDKSFTGAIDMVQEGGTWKVDRFTIP